MEEYKHFDYAPSGYLAAEEIYLTLLSLSIIPILAYKKLQSVFELIH